MSPTDSVEFERRLVTRGWSFHAGLGEFREGSRVVDFDDVVRLLPGVTDDDVAAWADDRMDQAEAAYRRDEAATAKLRRAE